MGVCRALVGNYLAVLAKGKRLKPPVVFQGATAQNEALVFNRNPVRLAERLYRLP